MRAQYHITFSRKNIEPELVPALRKFGIRLVIWNPVAGKPITCPHSFLEFFTANLAAIFSGGMLSGTYKSTADTDASESGGPIR